MALDSIVLQGIQANSPNFVAVHKLLQDQGFVFMAVPTVVQKLEQTRESPKKAFASACAHNILAYPQSLDVVLASYTDVQRDVTDIHVRRLVEKGILGADHAMALYPVIEAAYLDCMIFITTNDTILSNRQPLTLALMENCGMPKLHVFSPTEIVAYFKTPSNK